MKLIGQAQIASDAGEILMQVNSADTELFNPGDGELSIVFPGVDSTDQEGLVIAWDGKTENGGDVSIGDYYIKVTVTDSYGHVNTNTKGIKIVRTEEYARVSIYNTAGELVSRMERNISAPQAALLEMDDVIYVGPGQPPAVIQYTQSDSFTWDGRNMRGKLVANGTYELLLEVKNSEGYYVAQSSMTFTVLNTESAPALNGLKVYPNPFILDGTSAAPAVIDWDMKQPGEIIVRIYNVSGELVKTITGALDSPAGLQWDLVLSNGDMAASGLYIAVATAKKPGGTFEMKTVKFVIINRFASENNLVN